MKKPITSWGRFLGAFGYKVKWSRVSNQKRKSKNRQSESLVFEKLQPRELLAGVRGGGGLGGPPAPPDPTGHTASVSFEVDTLTQNEGTTMQVAFVLSESQTHTVVVTGEINDGTTSRLPGDADFSTDEVFSVTFAPGQTRATFDIELFADNQLDAAAAEEFNVVISDVSGAGVGSLYEFRGVIDDSDDDVDSGGGAAPPAGPSGFVEFVSTEGSAPEGSMLSASLRYVGHSHQKQRLSVLVGYVANSGSADIDIDFTYELQHVAFNGAGFGTVTAQHLPDEIVEPPEDYYLKIISVKGIEGVEVGENDLFRGIITDSNGGDEPGAPAYVDFVEPNGSEVEGLSLYPLLKLSDPDIEGVTATVAYVPESGSATQHLDFSFSSVSVTFDSNGYASFDVPHLTDSESDEGSEDYTLEIVSVSGPNVHIGDSKEYVGTITDVSAGGDASVSFVKSKDYEIEGETLVSVLQVTGASGAGVSAVVSLVPDSGSATPDIDFTFATQTVSFGEDGYGYVEIPHLEDVFYDEGLEDYIIKIESVSPASITIGEIPEFTGVILDSEYLVEIDLDVDSDNDGELGEASEDPIEHNPDYPGKYISVNNQDRDFDNIVDSHDKRIGTPTEHLTPVRVKIEDHNYIDLDNAQLSFDYSFNDAEFVDTASKDEIPNPGNGTFRLWKDGYWDDGDLIIRPGETFSPRELGFDEETAEVIFYLEAVRKTPKSNRHDSVKVELTGPDLFSNSVTREDEVLTRAVEVDLDVDTDNTNGLFAPERNGHEEHLELWHANTIDILEDPFYYHEYGKLVPSNGEDIDQDGIMDYEDPLISSEHGSFKFTPLVLQAPDLADLTNAKIRFEFEDASGLDISLDPADQDEYDNSKKIRIWTVDGDQVRSFALVQDQGDLIESGFGYSPSELGLDDDVRTITLFIEGFTASSAGAEISVNYELGEELEAEADPLTVITDKLRVSVVQTDLDIDSDNDDYFELPERSYAEDLLENKKDEQGKLVYANHGDRDDDGLIDHSDWQIPGGRFYRVVLETIEGLPYLNGGALSFHIDYNTSHPGLEISDAGSTDEGKIRLWRKDAWESRHPTPYLGLGGDYLAPGVYRMEDILNLNDGELYVEGISPSGLMEDENGALVVRPDLITVNVYYNDFRIEQLTDVVKLYVSGLDADTDSDNNNGFELPARDAYEDEIEDSEEDPGKILLPNDGDADNDEVLDYLEAPSEPLTGVQFVPLVIELPVPNPTGVAEASFLEIDYTKFNPSMGDSSDNGHIRIWRTDAGDRDAQSASGNLIEPGVRIPLSELGIDSDTRTVTLFVEGILSSQKAGDERVEVRLLNSDYITVDTDAVRFTVRGHDHVEVTAPDRFARESDGDASTPEDTAFFTFSKGEEGSDRTIRITYRLKGSGVNESEDNDRTLILNGNEMRKSIYLVPASAASGNEIGLESLNADNIVEWDRYVSVEIVDAEELGSDGQPTEATISVASSDTVRILDVDGVSATVNRNVDFDATGLVRSSTDVGQVSVDRHEGTIELLVGTPHGIHYNSGNQLFPIVNIQTKLPSYSLDHLSASVSFGFVGGVSRPISLTDLQPDSEIHLVVMASEAVATRYSTGRFAFDVSLVGRVGDVGFARTYVGSQEYINTSLKGKGDEFGVGWRHSEIDRLYFDSGFSGRFTRAGLSPQSGLSLIRGDNTSAYYPTAIADPSSINFVAPPENSDPRQPWEWKESDEGYYYADASVHAAQPDDEKPTIEWELTDVQPDTPFQVFVEWTPDFDRTDRASYKVGNANPLGPTDKVTTNVDQRKTPADFLVNGKRWRSLGWFTQDKSLEPVVLELTAVNSHSITVAGEAFAASEFSYIAPVESIGSSLGWGTPTHTVYRYAADTGEVNGNGFILQSRNGQEYVFTAEGLLVANFDRHGNQSRYVYENFDNDLWADELSKIIRQGGAQTEFLYANGYLKTVVESRLDSQGATLPEYRLETEYRITPSFLSESGGLLHQIVLPDTGAVESQTPVFNFGYTSNRLLDFVAEQQGENQVATRIEYRAETNRVAKVVRIGGTNREFEFVSLLEDAYYNRRVTGAGSLQDGEARAAVVDGRNQIWQYQTDNYGLNVITQKPVLNDKTYVWRTERDSIGRVKKIIEPRQFETSFNSNGLPVRHFVTATRETVFEYATDGNYLHKITYAAGTDDAEVETWVRQLRPGNGISFLATTKFTERDGTATTYSYPGTKTSPAGMTENSGGGLTRTTTYGYTDNPVSSSNPDTIFMLPGGLTKSSEVESRTQETIYWGEHSSHSPLYKGLVRSQAVRSGSLSEIVSFSYDENRNLKSSSSRSGTTNYRYDRLGQLIETTYPVQSYVVVDENNKIGPIDFNSLGLPSSVQDAATRKRDINHYDARGNLVISMDHRNDPYAVNYDLSNSESETYATTQYRFNEFGELEEARLPSAQSVSTAYPTVTRFDYDANGNLIYETLDVDGQSRQTSYTYDSWNRQLSMKLPTPVYQNADGQWIPEGAKKRPIVFYEYDVNDNLATESDANVAAAVERHYDIHDRLVAEVVVTEVGVIAQDAPVTKYTYDANGRVTELSRRVGRTNQGTESANAFATTTYIYDGLGRLKETHEPADQNGHRRKTIIGYNAHDEVETQTVEAKMFSFDNQPDGAANVLVSRVETGFYDGIGRLIGVNREGSPEDGASTSYAYDSYGYLEAELVSSNPLSSPTSVFSLSQLVDTASDSPGAIQQLTRYRNDRLGNVIAMVSPDMNGESGSTQKLLDDDGSVVSLYRHDLSGNPVLEIKLFKEQRIADLENISIPSWETTALVTGARYDSLDRAWFEFGVVDETGNRPESKTLYTGDGNVRRVVGKNGAVLSEFEYDNLGRAYRSTNYDGLGGSITTQQYMDANGNVLRKIDSFGWFTDEAFDYANRPSSTTRYVSDAGIASDGPLSHDNGNAVTTTTSYYPDGLVKSVDHPTLDSDKDIYTYDHQGNLLEQKETRNTVEKTTKFKHDGFGNLVLTTNPSGMDSWFSYNADGKVTVEASEGNDSRYFGYDDFGRLKSVDFGQSAGIASFSHIDFEYTSTGWIESESMVVNYGEDRRNEFTYTPLGEIVFATAYGESANGDEVQESSYWYQYDAARKLQFLQQDFAFLDGKVKTLVTSDTVNRTRSETVSYTENNSPIPIPRDIVTRDFHFDNLGRLRQLNQAGDAVQSQSANYVYDATRLVAARYGAGDANRNDFAYFIDGRLNQFVFRGEDHSTAVASHAFKYDELGREIEQKINVVNKAEVTIDRTPEDFLRPPSVEVGDYGKGFTEHPGWNLHESDYDDLGRVQQFDALVPDSYDQLLKKVRIGFDLKDRITELVIETKEPTSSSIFWDETRIEYDYDAFGNLIRTVAVDPNDVETQTIYVPDTNGNRSLVFQGDQPKLVGVATNQINGTTVFAQHVTTEQDGSFSADDYMIAYYDHQGKWQYGMKYVEVGSSAGLQFQHTVYDADGRIRGDGTDFVGLIQQFKGFDYDPESSFYFKRGRSFFAGLGVFLSPDNSGLARGANNLYQRTANAPNGQLPPSTFGFNYFAEDVSIWDQPEIRAITAKFEIVGGLVETAFGVYSIVQTGGVGGVAGGLVLVAHGLDTVATGYHNLFNTESATPARTVTYNFVKMATSGSELAANVVDIGLGFVTPGGIAKTSSFVKGAVNSTRVGRAFTSTARDVGYLFKHGTRAAYQNDGLLGAAGKVRSNFGQWRRGETITCFVAGTPVLVPMDQLERYRMAEVSSDQMAATLTTKSDENNSRTLGFTVIGLSAIGWGVVQYNRVKKESIANQVRRRQKEIDRLIYEEFSLGWI